MPVVRGPVHIIYILKGFQITLLLGNTIHTSLGGTDQYCINITLQTLLFERITFKLLLPFNLFQTRKVIPGSQLDDPCFVLV